jgi:hypothetical protein
MNTEKFNDIVKTRLNRTEQTLCVKAGEYAHGDRLSNFKDAAHLLKCTNEKALAGLVVKHIVALFDFIHELERGKCREYPYWDEKIGDIQAYLCLLDAMIQERIEKQEQYRETNPRQ